MICVYDVGENHYDRLGSCVLTPIKGSHRQIAGGSYELTLEHPIDAGGKWTHLQNGAIIKAPVPEETIEDAREGMAADIYRTVAEAELREEPSEPQVINYPIWPSTTAGENPGVGMKTTHMNKNYKCTFWDDTSRQAGEPPTANSWWTQIARYTSGSPVIVKLPAGETLYLIEAEGGWYLMMTPYGVQGYIKTDKVEFVKHVEPGEITSHVITEQLFRITEVDIDNEANKVTVKARHVSYDLNGILCEDMEISQASAAMAISRIAQGLMMDYPGAIATNLTDTAGTYTQSIKGRNGGFCLLDPDRGVLPAFGAMLKRDNWDVFVLKKKHTDRGYRIRYGKNAKGINWQRKVQDLVTRVVPVAKNEDGSNLYLPEKWVDSTHIGDYPTIIMEWLRVDGQVGKDDGTGTDTVWTAENLYTEMRTKAGERFTVDKVDVPAEEVTVNFEQLGDTAEYPWMRERETILLYDKVQAIDERIGLRMDLYLTEIEYDVIRQKVTGVKLSNTDSYRERTVTGFNVQDNSITPRKLTDEVKDSFMASAVGVMPNYANSNTWKPNTASSEGYVQKGEGNANKVWATNGDGEPGWRTPGSYSLPLAADGTRGGVQIGYTQSGKNYPVQLDGEKMYVNVPWTDTKAWESITGKPATATRWPSWSEVTDKPGSFYTLPLAANGTRGGVQVGYTTSAANRNYAVQLSGEKMYVNVPWSDTNTWRPVVDALNSTAADSSLSAKQGKVLNDSKVAKAGDTMTGALQLPKIIYDWQTATNAPLIALRGAEKYGIWYHESDPDRMRFSASGDADSNNADFMIVGGTSGNLYHKGNVILDAANYSNYAAKRTEAIKGITRSGTTFTATRCDGTTFTFDQQDTNTWRGIQNNLTSTSTTDSLSAAMGKALNEGKVDRAGDKMTGLLEITSNYDNWREGIRIHTASTGWTTLILCGSDNTGSTGSSANSWSFHTYNGNFYLAKNGSSSATVRLENVNGVWGWTGVANGKIDVSNVVNNPYSGTTFVSGSSSAGGHDCNALTENGHYYYGSNGPATSLGATTTDGALYVQSYNSSWVAQIAQDYRNGNLFVRGKNNGTWQSWKRILNGDDNYNLEHGYARDNRVLYLNLSPGEQKSIEIKSANGGYAVIWRLGKANSHGVKFGSGDNCTNIVLNGTDYLGVTYNMQTVTFKNNNSSYYIRAWVFYNGSPGLNLDPDD